jgi:hypothetical protein
MIVLEILRDIITIIPETLIQFYYICLKKFIGYESYSRRKTKNNIHVYQPGDIIEGFGVVDTNHCGMPWIPCVYYDWKNKNCLEYEQLLIKDILLEDIFTKEQLIKMEEKGIIWKCYGELCGVITVFTLNGQVSCDAITGKILSREELEERKNNQLFNYFESGIAYSRINLPSIDKSFNKLRKIAYNK